VSSPDGVQRGAPVEEARAEGRFLAQQRVLAALAAAVLEPASEGAARLRALLSPDEISSVHAEDPGAVPDPAFAVLAAEDAELRAIARGVADILGSEL
jgi:hypothetical protein